MTNSPETLMIVCFGLSWAPYFLSIAAVTADMPRYIRLDRTAAYRTFS